MSEWITWEIIFGFLGTLTVVAGFIVGIYRTREMTRPKPIVEEVSESAIKTEMIELKVMIKNFHADEADQECFCFHDYDPSTRSEIELEW